MTDNKQLSLDLATTALIQRRTDEIKLLVRKTTETIIEITPCLQVPFLIHLHKKMNHKEKH